nr:floral homeotic protein APETALA 1 C-like [Solanum lycopersicum]
MGRKIEIKKIEETTKRQVTFSKRRSSLLKKAEEIAFCCDVDVLFVAFSPSGRLNKFCSPQRDYETGAEQEPSLHQLRWCESNLKHSLQKILARKMKLEKQGNMDVHSVAQQMAPHQFDTNNWISPFSSTIQNQDWMDKGKRVANSSSNYTYTPSFAGSSHLGNMPISRNPSPFTPLQSQQQNMVVGVQKNPTQTFGQSQSHQQHMVVDVQQNSTQTFGQLQNQQQNMLVDIQHKSAQTFGLSEAQLTFGESSDNSLTKFWHNDFASTRYDSSSLVNTGTQLNTPSQLGLEYDHSNWNINLDNNNNINHIIQSNDQSSIQSDAIASNVNELNFPMEENTMGNNEYFAETTHENDAWEWDDVFLNEAFGGDDF